MSIIIYVHASMLKCEYLCKYLCVVYVIVLYCKRVFAYACVYVCIEYM